MPKSSYQKLKLLYIKRILEEKTDENHTITVPQIIEELERYGISAERKSIYDDLEALRIFGLDIESVKTKTTGYYIASREFELPEPKLLADVVASSKFIKDASLCDGQSENHQRENLLQCGYHSSSHCSK